MAPLVNTTYLAVEAFNVTSFANMTTLPLEETQPRMTLSLFDALAKKEEETEIGLVATKATKEVSHRDAMVKILKEIYTLPVEA